MPIGARAFIWDELNGMRLLQDVLENNAGLNLVGWNLEVAESISNDGMTIAGFGTNPSGNIEAWVANINPIPEPSTMLLFGTGLAGLMAWRYRKGVKS